MPGIAQLKLTISNYFWRQFGQKVEFANWAIPFRWTAIDIVNQ